jgi:hypothetical protein
MKRFQQILIGLLVVQLALAAVVFWPRTTPASASGGLLFAQLKADDIVALTVSGKDGKSLKLARQGDAKDAKWVLPEVGDYPVLSTKVTPVTTALAGLKSNRLVTRTAASHDRLQVADNNFAARLDFQTTDGKSYTLFLGSTPGAGTIHVRVAGQNEVYLAGGLNTYDIKPDASVWVDTAYTNVTAADVVTMTIKNANGQWSFNKDDKGTWTMQGLATGEKFNADALQGIVAQMASLPLTLPLGKTDQPAYGLSQPSAVVSLTTKKDNQEKTYTLQVGSKDAKDNSYVVKSSESPYYVRVAEYTVKDVVEKKRDGFLVVATPAPAAAPGATPGASSQP